MTDTPDTIETFELGEEQLTIEDIIQEAATAAYRPILELWREILKPAATERDEKITPQWAHKIISKYPHINYDDMPDYRDLFYTRLQVFNDIVLAEIETDDECLRHTSAEEDVEHNSHHYLNILVNWQKALLSWELEWDCTHEDAAIDVAATTEIARMFFDSTGIAALLDQINFQFTEESQAYLTAELEELKNSWAG